MTSLKFDVTKFRETAEELNVLNVLEPYDVAGCLRRRNATGEQRGTSGRDQQLAGLDGDCHCHCHLTHRETGGVLRGIFTVT